MMVACQLVDKKLKCIIAEPHSLFSDVVPSNYCIGPAAEGWATIMNVSWLFLWFWVKGNFVSLSLSLTHTHTHTTCDVAYSNGRTQSR